MIQFWIHWAKGGQGAPLVQVLDLVLDLDLNVDMCLGLDLSLDLDAPLLPPPHPYQLDDALGHLVPRRRLAPDDAQARHHLCPLRGAHLLDQAVAVDDAQHVEQLALVLVDALDLDVKHGGRVHLDTWGKGGRGAQRGVVCRADRG